MSSKNKFNEEEYEETKLLKCACGSKEHLLIFELEEYQYDDTLRYVEFTTSVLLSDYQNIFQKIWAAVKYVLGYKCKNGHWDSMIIKEEDADKLIHMCEQFKKLSAKNAKYNREKN